MSLSVLGLDIGGANLKAAHTSGSARQHAFELWKHPSRLPRALEQLLQQMPDFAVLAVTMTGELSDCFATRREGVHCILNAVEEMAGGRKVAVWSRDGRFVELAQARERPLRAAAANWLALSHLAARFARTESALLVDVGSTTTDVVPLCLGRPVPRALTDRQRLRVRELVYTGVRRTPLCALLGASAAAEVFASTLDAYLLLGKLAEDDGDFATADGRPATIRWAKSRLAHMLCSDTESCPESPLVRLANKVFAKQTRVLAAALEHAASRLQQRVSTVITAGCGEFLAERALDQCSLFPVRRISLSEKLGPQVSTAAPAYAVAMLAREQYGR